MTENSSAIGLIQEVDIVQEMQEAYLDYAMSVIVARALPDVRDGLKPVHRRILYAMHDMGLLHDRPYKKSARIVGEVLGKYHPHGDAAVYDAMVRMAQDFSLRYPLVDGQGNFGSIDGDNAAAMRYTEARLAEISQLMWADLHKDTVDWRPNFDNTLQEPAVLPAVLPNLLVNGANGIAVGMATNIPPHNLGEVIDALVYVIERWDRLDQVGVDDLMRFIQGPDFPTGGIVYRYRVGPKGEEQVDAIAQGYATGRARLVVQAKAHFEEMSRGRSRIVVTELPYQTNKTNLLERIATLVREDKIEGITDLRDESDRTGMRIVIELTRNVDPKAVLAELFKHTPLQQTFGMSMLALVNGEPRVLNLKRILQLFVEHRQEVVRRRSEFDLARARERIHIVEGLLKALDILDQVIATIRRSRRVETARTNLMRQFGFTQVQAQAILDMPLKRLAALERRRLQEEFKELQGRIRHLEALLASPRKMLALIKEELLEVKERFADGRRTQIVARTKGTLTATDLLPDQPVWVTVGANGELRRHPYTGLSGSGLRKAGRNGAVAVLLANTRHYLYLFNTRGRCCRVGIHRIPEGTARHLADLTDFSRRDTVRAVLALPRAEPHQALGALFLATERGTVKRIALADFLQAAPGNPEVMRVEAGDALGWAFTTSGQDQVILVTQEGQSIRFAETEVRTMGLAAGGVAGIKLRRGDRVVAACRVIPEGQLLSVTRHGFAKRTPLAEYSVQGRHGSGIIAHRIADRTGPLVHAAVVDPRRHPWVLFVTAKGVARPTELEVVPVSGRSTQGGLVVPLAQGDGVAAVHPIAPLEHSADGAQARSLRPAETSPGRGRGQRSARAAGTPRRTGDGKAASRAPAGKAARTSTGDRTSPSSKEAKATSTTRAPGRGKGRPRRADKLAQVTTVKRRRRRK